VLALASINPPKAEAGAFERIAAPVLERSLISRHECHTLAALRDALLPKLISGELRVKDAERIADGVA
jgi:type I restriction enzyme S subunit